MDIALFYIVSDTGECVYHINSIPNLYLWWINSDETETLRVYAPKYANKFFHWDAEIRRYKVSNLEKLSPIDMDELLQKYVHILQAAGGSF
jgi:hypothetical protein